VELSAFEFSMCIGGNAKGSTKMSIISLNFIGGGPILAEIDWQGVGAKHRPPADPSPFLPSPPAPLGDIINTSRVSSHPFASLQAYHSMSTSTQHQ